MSEHIRAALGSPLGFRLTSSLVCAFHEAAMRGLLATAGRLRERSDVEIRGSRHVPPPHEDVGRLLDEFCAFVNDRRDEDPLFIAAYVLWRLCWIHPFDDGNGRTARAISYLMLSIRVGVELPGDKPIPLRLKYAPIAYWRALEGTVSGSVKLSSKSAGKKAAYNWRYSTDQKTWTSLPQTLVAKTGVSGLTPATTYYFQCETQTVKGGEGGWGQVVSFLVQ